jgi:hypothetical protein
MIAMAFLFVRVLCDCFKSRRRLETEILVLRHRDGGGRGARADAEEIARGG